MKTTTSEHPALARANKRLYLVASSKGLKDVMARATYASGCVIEVVKDITEITDADPNVGALIVEAGAIVSDEQSQYLEKLASVYNTLVFNEGFDSTVVELLRGDLCNHAIHIDRLSMDQLIITMNKLLTGDIFGIEKYLPWGVPVQEIQITSYEDKREATEQIDLYVQQLGCRAPLVARIVHAVEELLMNALYDAPIEEGGGDREEVVQKLINGGQAAGPVTMRYASGGNVFILSVTDTFGRLSKGTIIERLRGRPDDEPGTRTGAGLYVLLSKATRVIVNVAHGSCTEVISFFDLDWPVTYQGVRSFHYFEEPEKK